MTAMPGRRSLDGMVGNAQVRDGLLAALERSRLPHALLFHGPPGVGKRAAAHALARALLCEEGPLDACGDCGPCRRAAGGNHPDLLEVAPDGQFVKVDAVRTVVRTAQLRPFEGRAKVVIFPRADAFNDESANTLLKTLEEPPQATYLILVTSNRDAVLPTLRSRCQALEFRPLGRAELERQLSERDGLDPETAARTARHARFGEIDAEAIDLEAIAAARGEALETLLPLTGTELTVADAERVIKLAERYQRKGSDLDGFLLRGLRPLVRDALLAAVNADESLLAEVEDARRLGAALGADGAARLLAELDAAEEDLHILNANKKLVVEALLLGVYERSV